MDQVPPHSHKEDRILEKDLIPDDTVYSSLPATAPEGARAVVESVSLIKFYRMVKGIWRQLNAMPEIDHFHFPLPWHDTNSIGIAVQLNKVRAYKVNIPGQITVNKIIAHVTNPGAVGTKMSIGVYSADGNTKHIDSGLIDADSLGVKTITLASPVTLSPGSYWIVWTGNDGAIQCRGQATDNGWSNVYNGDTVLAGTATNSSGGALNATLGAVTAGAIDVIYIKLQN